MRGSSLGKEIKGIWRDTGFWSSLRSFGNNTAFGMQAITGALDVLRAEISRARRTSERQTFEQAIAERHLSEDDLVDRHNAAARTVMWMVCTALVFIGAAVVYLSTSPELDAPAMAFFFAILALSTAYRASYDAYRIRHHVLGHLGDFLRSPGEWIPGFIHVSDDSGNSE